MIIYRTVEVVSGLAILLLSILNFRVALLHTKPSDFSVINIAAGVLFYLGAPMLVALGSYIHGVKREPWGRVALLIGGVVMIGISMLFVVTPFPRGQDWEQFLLIAPGGIVVITMLSSLLVKPSVTYRANSNLTIRQI